MIYKMDLKDSVDTMTFNLLETPIVDKDIEGAVDNVTLDGNQYTDYLYLKKQYIQKWAIMCPDEYDELRGFYTRQFEEGEVPSYRVYYGANVTRDYTLNGDYFQFSAEGIETGMTLSQLLGNAEQTTYSGKNLANYLNADKATNDTTLTFVDDGFRQVTTSAGFGTKLPITGLTASTTYTISWSLAVTSGTANKVVRVFEGTGQSVTYATRNQVPTGAGHLTFTTGASATSVNIWFYNGIPSAGDTTWTNIMLEKGSAATAYEPYVGGIPAPNPDYPQPISTVTGEQNIEVMGKNLLNIDFTSTTTMGITITNNGDGTVTVSGTTTGVAGYDLSLSATNQDDPLTLAPNTAYTQRLEILSGSASNFGIVPAFKDSGGTVHYNFFSNNQTTTTTDTMTCSHYNIYWGRAGLVINATFRVWLEKGSDLASPYEPYHGQSYEVNLGKNLFDKDNSASVLNAYIDNSQSVITANSNNRIIWIACEPNTTYTIQRGWASGGVKLVAYTTSQPAVGVQTYEPKGWNADQTSVTYTTGADARFIVVRIWQFTQDAGHTVDEMLASVQIEKGSQATSYAPYFTPIELAKVGNYQDRIYKNDGKWYIERNVGKVVYDGSENWSLYPTKTKTFMTSIGTRAMDGVSDHFTKGYAALFDVRPCFYPFNTNNLIFSMPSVADLAGWKTWLASNPTTVYYALATPTTTEITDETLLSQLNFLASLYKGENNISLVGTGAQGEMEVFIRDVMSVETDVVPEVPVRLTLTDDGVINACGCRRNVQLTMRETTE